MLVDIVGGFISAADIPSNAVVRRGLYSDLVFSIIDTIYDHCYNCIQGINKEIDIVAIPRKPTDVAIQQFKLFNLLNDIDNLIVNNKVIRNVNPEREAVNITNYINKVVPRYFRYNIQQIDCCKIVDGTLGELNIIISSIDKPMLLSTESNLRTTKSKYIVIANEVRMLNNLKAKFIYMNKMLYAIMQKLYKIGAKEMAPIDVPEIDL